MSRSAIRFNVHYLHDPDSVRLAELIVELADATVRIPEPVDDLGWSGVRIYDEQEGGWLTSLKWARGAPRDLEQAAHQLTVAINLRVDGEGHKARKPKAERGAPGTEKNEINSESQGVKALLNELGIQPKGRFRRKTK